MSSVAKWESLVSASPKVLEFRMVLISGMIYFLQQVYWCICRKRMRIMTRSVCMSRLRGRAGNHRCDIARTDYDPPVLTYARLWGKCVNTDPGSTGNKRWPRCG